LFAAETAATSGGEERSGGRKIKKKVITGNTKEDLPLAGAAGSQARA
jgi:hypothetical protein